ncbi:MAG TPA: hypothetical protein VEX70_07485 [Pyrinomonadaceae bacterium]|nr:hypothetical protein [Pyrinomonadaceae bacterium]
MSITFERPPDETDAAVALLAPGGLSPSAAIEGAIEEAPAAMMLGVEEAPAAAAATMLGALALGARLVLRCRKDWRTATIVRIEPEKITLSVNSPTGRTYRMSRPPDAPLIFDGSVPLLGATDSSGWRAALARYDVRW